MEELVKLGKVKSIGVSNFNIDQMKDILNNSTIKPVCNQIEVNPFCRNNELVEFCQKNGVAIVAYAPFGGSKDRDFAVPGEPKVFENEYISGLAKKYNSSIGKVVLRWLYQRDIISIPKSLNPVNIKDNLDVISQQDFINFFTLKFH
jgi:diketogulonate reductase-like aldo/keto reductase